MVHTASKIVSNEAVPEAQPEVERARRFLRDIRAGVASHPVAGRTSRIVLQERRLEGVSVLRLSGTLDGVLVDLQIEVPDQEPLRPQLRYSSSLDRLRSAPVMGLATSAFTVAHDRAFAEHYGREPAAEELRRALAQVAARGSFGLH